MLIGLPPVENLQAVPTALQFEVTHSELAVQCIPVHWPSKVKFPYISLRLLKSALSRHAGYVGLELQP